MNDHCTNWYLARLKPNGAWIAERNLKRQGFVTFLPLEEETRRSQGRFAMSKRPLFPGYIFVALEASGGHWRVVNATTGITSLVSFGGVPAQVPSDVMMSIMQRCDGSGTLLPPKLLKPGDKVTLTSGPFVDFGAIVLSIAPDRRVWLLMEIMGGQTRVAVASDQLRYI